MSGSQTGLLQAILEDPDDNSVRLIYADYLEERGDSRAEFIRVQVQLSLKENRDDAWQHLQSRQDELLAAHREQWTQELQPFDSEKVEIRFARGFPEEMTVTDGTVKDLEVLKRAAGLRKLELN